jgi:hypothetical protein
MSRTPEPLCVRKTCRVLLTSFLVLFVTMLAIAEAPADDRFAVKEVPANRWLPHAFHDQAMASIGAGGAYPHAEVVGHLRTGEHGGMLYAFVAYLPSPDSPLITIDALATDHRRAFSLQAAVPHERYDEARRAMLDAIRGLLP